MAADEIGPDELAFRGSLGAVVAITFVLFEILLLPLFEYTRESLSIALVRGRIAKGKPVNICPETSIPLAFGLSDGLFGNSRFIIIPRALKIFVKVALIVSIFAWEFQLDTIDRAQWVSFQFNAKGPLAPKTQSAVIFPFPIQEFSQTSPDTPLTPEVIESERKRHFLCRSQEEKFYQCRIRDIEMDYAAHCVLTEASGRRAIHLANLQS